MYKTAYMQQYLQHRITAGGYPQGENELEEDLLDQVQNCLGAVLEQFGDTAMPLMEGLMPQIGVLLTPKSSVEEKRVGICIMDDIMEHTQEGEPVLPLCSAPPSPLFPGQHTLQVISVSNGCHACLFTISNRNVVLHSFIHSFLSNA